MRGTRRIGGAAFQYQRQPRARMPAAADGPMAPVDAVPGRGARPCVEQVGDGDGGVFSSRARQWSPMRSEIPRDADIPNYANGLNVKVHPKK